MKIRLGFDRKEGERKINEVKNEESRRKSYECVIDEL